MSSGENDVIFVFPAKPYRYGVTGLESFPLVEPADVRRRDAASHGRGNAEVTTAVRARRRPSADRRAAFGSRRPSAPPAHVDEGLGFRRRVLVHQMRQDVPDVARPGGALQEVPQREEAVLVRAVQQIVRRRDKPEPAPVSKSRGIFPTPGIFGSAMFFSDRVRVFRYFVKFTFVNDPKDVLGVSENII